MSVLQSSENVIALHRPGRYGVQHFKYKDDEYATGVTNETDNDNLMVEVILKQRNGETGVIFMEHDLKYNEFRDIDLDKVKNARYKDGLSLDDGYKSNVIKALKNF